MKPRVQMQMDVPEPLWRKLQDLARLADTAIDDVAVRAMARGVDAVAREFAAAPRVVASGARRSGRGAVPKCRRPTAAGSNEPPKANARSREGPGACISPTAWARDALWDA